MEVGNEFLANAACDPILSGETCESGSLFVVQGCVARALGSTRSFKSAQLETIVGATEMVDKALEKGTGF